MIGFETIFLLVLVLALIMGNALLSFFEPKPKPFLLKQGLIEEVSASKAPSIALDAMNSVQVTQTVLTQKLDLAHKRLDDMEETVRFSKSKPMKAENAFLQELGKKILELEEFRSSTRIELAALRQVLSDKKLNLAKRKSLDNYSKKLSNTGKEVDELEEKIRSIVFRGGK